MDSNNFNKIYKIISIILINEFKNYLFYNDSKLLINRHDNL